MIINCECQAYVELIPKNGILGILIVARESTIYFSHSIDGLQLLKLLELTKKFGYQRSFDLPALYTSTNDDIIQLHSNNKGFIQLTPQQLDQLIAQVKTAILINLSYYDYLAE